MDSASTDGSSASSPLDEEFNKPLWRYTTRYDKSVGGGGNIPWQCNFCNKPFKSSYTRVKAHLLKLSGHGAGPCSKVTDKDFVEMQKLDKETTERMKANEPRKVPLPPSNFSLATGGLSDFVDSTKKRKTKGTSNLEKAFNKGAWAHLDLEIARMYFSGGIPFNLARNPYYMSAFSYAANNSIPGYKPPGYNKLRDVLLVREKANIERLLTTTRSMWKEKGVSIVSDGWSDSQQRPLINFIAVMDGQPMFLKAVDCSGNIKDNLFKEVINEIGHENVVQVVTDNAPNCKGAGQLIEAQFPNIVWTPCVVHTLNLALKNICAAKNVDNNQLAYLECSWITDIEKEVVQIKNFIMNHSMRLAMFNDFVNLKLLSVAETRFASVIVMLRRFKLIKGGLQAMVISDKWACYREDDATKARFVKDKVLDDIWWDSINYILSFTAPIYDMLRACDTDKPCLHLVYDIWDTMIEKVKMAIYRHEGKNDNEPSVFYEVVHDVLVDRWNKNNTPLHCLAHSLNPRYYGDEWLQEDPRRVPPHKDVEISNGRVKCLKKYFPSIEDRNKVNMEYINFISKSGDFSEFDSISNRYSMDPMAWWLLHGSSAPMLQVIASKILVQPSSSSCAERNWSTYSFIHSMQRNKMTPQRAQDLVFIHSNLRLLSRRTPDYKQGDTKMWVIAGDAFDSFEDVGVLDVASLSLDEPELEAMIYADEDN